MALHRVNIPTVINIEEMTLQNEAYRYVFATSNQMQLVFMSLVPGQEIGMEVHPEITQFIRVEAGEGLAILNGRNYPLAKDSAVLIPAGTEHNIINTGSTNLKVYTIYAPPNHPVDRYQVIKPASD